MFHIHQYEINVNNQGIGIKLSNNDNISRQITNLLTEFEDFAFSELIKLNQFKFVQGEINAKKKFEEMSSKFTNLNCLMITQHPGFIGSIIIDKLLDLEYNSDTYLFFFENEFGKIWNNSSIKIDDLIRKLTQLKEQVIFKKEFKFNIISIVESDKISFKLANSGDKSKLWTIRE